MYFLLFTSKYIPGARFLDDDRLESVHHFSVATREPSVEAVLAEWDNLDQLDTGHR